MTNDFARRRGDVPLAVYIDMKSPYAYLAIAPTRAMAAAAEVAIDCAGNPWSWAFQSSSSGFSTSIISSATTSYQ